MVIKIITAMIKTKSGFFQVQVQIFAGTPLNFSRDHLCKAPEWSDTSDMRFTTGELAAIIKSSE